jgi:hypothetical protein
MRDLHDVYAFSFKKSSKILIKMLYLNPFGGFVGAFGA